ncbi:ribosome biogenesis GTPase Der [Hyphomonas sp. CACIAM 19H1]|uniref:ribosome biogenesis GTPase Der n=1 Tax=Hyphomonas sp. CACIAM 19H1 TaxID=1873716 RepID=UPI000DEE0372|nr:ribosome biogenesis GTPase Der [Hyphomonas sp. CACIAM 19H1]AXE63373.1 ribosome biogenesis GTPase Der [Hyphomonas sp. CACIAM 19H1]
MPLKLAIVGRPNVGKSTLFNRLVGKKIALVDDQPGVTRDRKMAEGRLASLPLSLIDTAGFENVKDDSLEARMRAQTEAAIAEADLVLFLVDARVGVTPEDETFAALLRKANLPVVLAANKAEGRAGEAGVFDAFSLGFGEPVGLSAEHGEGMAELYDAIRNALGEEAFERALEEAEPDYAGGAGDDILDKLAHIDIEDTTMSDDELVAAIEAADVDTPAAPVQADRPIRLAIVGRPNAGKSTLINQLLQSDRLLTGPEAGITRDSITIDWEWEGRQIRLVDTAGLRRKSKVQERLERMSTAETIRSLKYADIVALVMDAHEAMEKQDLQIADLALREGRGLVLVISKWDTVQDTDAAARHIRDMANRLMPNAGGAPVVFLSGLTGRNTEKLMPAVVKVYKDWTARAKTGDLNRWLRHTVEHHPPPSVQGKRIKPRYMAQMKARPPTFVLIASRGDQMPEGYKRYLVNGIREAFDMHGVPIRLFVRQGKNPYAGKVGPDGPPRYKRRNE